MKRDGSDAEGNEDDGSTMMDTAMGTEKMSARALSLYSFSSFLNSGSFKSDRCG